MIQKFVIHIKFTYNTLKTSNFPIQDSTTFQLLYFNQNFFSRQKAKKKKDLWYFGRLSKEGNPNILAG